MHLVISKKALKKKIAETSVGVGVYDKKMRRTKHHEKLKGRKNSKGRNVTHPLKPRMEFSRGAESD